MVDRLDSKCLILFDYDGVLVDSLPFNLSVVAEVLSLLGYKDFPSVDYCKIADCISLEEWARRIDMAETHLEPFVSQTHQHFTAGAPGLPLFEGVLQLLESLSAEHQLGVITGNISSAAREFLSKHGVAHHFSEIVGVETLGTKSEKISKFAARLGYPLDRVFYVGDAGTDVQQGKAAGVRTVAVTWGFQGRERLLREAPDHLVDSVAELGNIFLPRNRVEHTAFF